MAYRFVIRVSSYIQVPSRCNIRQLRFIIVLLMLVAESAQNPVVEALLTLITPFAGRESMRATSQRLLSNTNDLDQIECQQSNNIFLLSFDGAVAKTAEWRISQGIAMAYRVWPHLRENGLQSDVTAPSWLVNKMRACSHVMLHLPTDLALLARLLLEEQVLDEGRSIGKSGKYAASFHPRQVEETKPTSQPTYSKEVLDKKSRSSRPLTVGEIAANWMKGGYLAETLRIRYQVGKDDLDKLLLNTMREPNEPVSCSTNIMVDASLIKALIEDCRGRIMISVEHSCEKPIATDLLERVVKSGSTHGSPATSVQICNSVSEALELEQNSIAILCQSDTGALASLPATASSLAEEILQSASPGATLYVIQGSLHSLEAHVELFGDNIPRQGQPAHTRVRPRQENVRLSLHLAGWADNSHPNHVDAAMMNPWIQLLPNGIHELAELLSARVIPK